MIRFKDGPSGAMRAAWPTVHPELRQLLEQFAEFSVKNDLPEPVVTDLVRKPEGNVNIYIRFYQKLQEALDKKNPRVGTIDLEDDGTFRPLLASEVALANELRGKGLEELTKRAHARFSWHMCRCAADLRTRHYSADELKRVEAWFSSRCKQPTWEFLVHDVTAPHLHIGRRDANWRVLAEKLAQSGVS